MPLTSTFLGKWRIYIPNSDPRHCPSDGYASYESGGGSSQGDGFCVWYLKSSAGASYPPGKETNIAFILRPDHQLCFLLNSGQYIGFDKDWLPFVPTLAKATGFAFPGQEDFHNLPASFNSKIQIFGDGNFLSDTLGSLAAGESDEQFAPAYPIMQLTPTLAHVQASGTGDGLDFAWVDLTGADLQNVSLVKTDFSNCNLTNAAFTNCNFSSAILTHANLTGANLQFVLLTKADFSNCNLNNANFTSLNFNGAVMSNADLTGVTFNDCTLRGALLTEFSNSNLTNAKFINVDLTGAVMTNADLTGATFSYCTLDGAVLKDCNLTNTNFTGSTLLGTHFEGGTFQGTVLSDTPLVGAVFKQCDLTGAIANPQPHFYNTPLQPPSPTNPRTSLAGCRLNQSFLGNDWSMLDLTGATVLDLSSPLSSAAQPLIAKYAILTGLNNNNLVGLTLQNAVFDNAVLDGVGLNSSADGTSDLSGATLILASMHGTNLTGAILKGANLTGAQLGSLSQLFTLPAGFETLNNGPVDAALKDQFTQHGITLSTTATVSTLATGRVWQVNDVGNKIIYTIRLEDQSGNVKVLAVYAPAAAASLVDVYMPDAVLTGANLHGVIATGAQFYGAKARVDGFAILEEVEFNDANLSSVDFTQANLYGANLSSAKLFNAKFIHAYLSPSANLVPANLSNANLQGADFTDATLDGATLANAATAISVPTKVANQGGVYLFSLPYSGDLATLAEYTAELDAATTGFILPYNGDPNTLDDYVAALKKSNLDLFTLPFARQQPPIVLSATAQIDTIAGTVWQIVDKPQSYRLWTDPDETGANVLYVAPSLTNTQAGFEKRDTTLRWQTSAIADTPGQQWLLDNDSENQKNFSMGYVKFILKVNGNVLDVYGTAVHVMRLVDKEQQQIYTENCNQTVLDVSNMSSQTICPNESTLGVNQQGGKKWDTLWLRARTPPQPPSCVPTDYQFCPPQQTVQKETSHSQRASEPIDRDRN